MSRSGMFIGDPLQSDSFLYYQLIMLLLVSVKSTHIPIAVPPFYLYVYCSIFYPSS